MLIVIAVIFSGLLGLIIGSFINVLTIRYSPEKNEKISRLAAGRSFCPYCRRQLRWFELIPVVSFIFLAGRCRTCEKKISWQYPLVEIVSAAVFAGLAWRILSLDFIGYYFANFLDLQFLILGLIAFWLFFGSILIIISVIDLKHYLLPDKYLFPGIIAAVLLDIVFWFSGIFSKTDFFLSEGLNFVGPAGDLLGRWPVLINYFLGAVVFGGFLFLVYFFSQGRAMGFGDVKLGIFLGLILGWAGSILALALSFMIGSIAAIVLLIFKRKKFGQHIPFGPFLAVGALMVVFLGKTIINFYLNLAAF